MKVVAAKSFLLVGLAIACCSCGQKAQQQASKTPAIIVPANAAHWNADGKVLSQLSHHIDETKNIPRFSLEMPPGYWCKRAARDGQKMVLFRRQDSHGELFPAMQIECAPLPKYIGQGGDAKSGLRKWLSSIGRGTSASQVQPIECGFINDQPFYRAYWSRFSKNAREMTNGFTYATIYQNTFIFLAAQDKQHSDALPLFEAAVLTFRTSK